MLIGRQSEIGRLDAALTECLAGHGGTLILRGDAGVGKTALLEHVSRRGCEDGLRLLSGRGTDAETDIAFAALTDVLGPLTERFADLPRPQAAALGGALALAPTRPGDRLAVCVATHGVLSATARSNPLLVAVDDAHWLDVPSLECLLFAARRGIPGMLLVITTREPAPPGLADAAFGQLAVEALPHEDAWTMLKIRSPDLGATDAARVLATAAGNPLAIAELTAPSAETAPGGAPVLDTTLGRIYGARVGAFDDATAMAVLITSLSGSDELRAVIPALQELGLEAATLEAGEAAGLLTIGEGRVRFVHPLARAAVRDAASAAQRRVAHSALAATLDDGERRTRHRALACIGPDEDVAGDLERSGDQAMARRAPESAARSYERAARLSPDPCRFSSRIARAATAAMAAGEDERALRLCDEAAAVSTDLHVLAQVARTRGQTLIWRARVGESVEVLLAQVDALADIDPAAAGRLVAEAAVACTGLGDAPRALALARRAERLLAAQPDLVRAPAAATRAFSVALRGHARHAMRLVSLAESLAAGADAVEPGSQWLTVLWRARLMSGDLEGATDRALTAAAVARDAGALGALAGALVIAGDGKLRLGEWSDARTLLDEGLDVAREAGQHLWRGYGLIVRCRLDAARGEIDRARGAAEAARDLAEATGVAAGRRYAHAALGFIALSDGDPAAAADHLDAAARVAEASGIREQVLVPWGIDWVEANVAAGSPDRLRQALAWVERTAARGDGPLFAAMLERCRGLAGDDPETRLARAVDLEAAAGQPFEQARALLAHGRHLHRARRRIEARRQLRAARELFRSMDATPWAAQANAELRAAGGRSRSEPDGPLTAQEQRVAALVAEGISNREAAERLFLSPKTVEFHLGRIYAKLGIRSRAALAGWISSGAGREETVATNRNPRD